MAVSSTQGFPKFGDGDVLLIVSTTQYYKLHSQVLSTHSQWFADQIAARPPPRLNAQARRENAASYRFELQNIPGEEGPGRFIRIVQSHPHLPPSLAVSSGLVRLGSRRTFGAHPTDDFLVLQDVNESGRSARSSLPLVPNFENGKVESMTNQSWDWLFGVFYNREPRFDDGSLASVLTCVMALIEVAESVSAIDHVRDIVDLALMRQDQVLWTSIMGNPVVWIELGRRVRSPSIYREAAVHLVGQWGVIAEEDKDRIGGDIRAVLDRKAEELALAKEAIEMRILGHYPQFMMRTAAEKPGRPSYSGDIYMWMSVCFFRQWFAQNVSDDRTRRAPDGGLNFYSALHEGGGAYLTHLDFKTFHQYFPMSIKACHVLEANMGVLKEDVKQFVSELMEERTHLKRSDHEITWLTCARVEKEDMPWFPAATSGSGSASGAAGHNNKRRRQDEELRQLYDVLGHENDMLAATTGGHGHGQTHTPSRKSQKTQSPRNHQRGKKRARRVLVDDVDDDDDEGYGDDDDIQGMMNDDGGAHQGFDFDGVALGVAGAAGGLGTVGGVVGGIGGLISDDVFDDGDESGMFVPEDNMDFIDEDNY